MNPGTRAIVACCCLSLLCILAYGRSLTAPFVWDDDTLIVQNPALGSARFFLDAFSTVYWRQGPFPEDYRPFEAWSYGIDSLIWPDNPLGFHISNLLIHIINCVILYFLFRRVTGSERCALLGGVLFALHPIHSEAVIWVQNRSELLAAAFILISLCACLRYLRNDGRGTRWYALCLGTCSCAALTKESALILPLLAAALLPFSGGTTARRRSCVGGLVIVAAACAAIKLGIAIWSPLPALSLPPVYGTLKHLYAVVRTAWCYLGMLALPMNFSIDRYFVPPVPPYPIGYSCAAAALLLCLAITLLAYRAHRTPGLAAAILLIALIPVANIIYIAGRPLSEGRCYVPSMGFCLLAASAIEGLRRIRPSKRLPLLIAAALATAYLLITLMRAETWRNEKVLWERTTEVSPSSWKAKLFLAKIYREEGRYDEAVSLLKRILRTVTPRPPMACVDLGRVYDEIGWYPHAREAYERAVAADPLY
ncbi:MAG: tetratricopeptide repeat protein, partial [Candidatus Aureabacteria bacterium]|nr:tetratricopeptide repeat protein [Candidatus Auribacterota bacterium]